MRIGIAKEIKPAEGRVALLPRHVQTLTDRHEVFIEANAGALSDAGDDDYLSAGARIITDAGGLYEQAELIVKVKEILPQEFGYLNSNHIIFTNLHSAADRAQLDVLLKTGLTAIAAEEIHQYGSPNCPLAGEIGALEGLRLTLAPHGGSGRHFIPHYGAPPCEAIVIGLGGVGRGALRTLLSLGVKVMGFDSYAGALFKAKLDWPNSNFSTHNLDELDSLLPRADMVVNCVLWDKSRDDHLITKNMLKTLKPTAVIVDIACDTGGAIETCRPTDWKNPVYEVAGIRHFCVDNIPGAAPVTASAGYGNALLPMVSQIADNGVIGALKQNPQLAKGLTAINGVLTLKEAAQVQNRDYTPAEQILKTL